MGLTVQTIITVSAAQSVQHASTQLDWSVFSRTNPVGSNPIPHVSSLEKQQTARDQRHHLVEQIQQVKGQTI